MEHERVLQEIVDWARADENIRAVVLSGSAALGDSYLDELSDLDVELYVRAPELLLDDSSWYARFGEVLVVEALTNPGWNPTRLVYYVGGKVDFMVGSVGALGEDSYDRPFCVLVDKDDLAIQLTTTGAEWAPPGPEQFHECANRLYAAALMWANYLVRDEPWSAKIRDWDAKQELLKMIEWDHKARYGAQFETWFGGKRFNQWVDADVRASLERCWSGFGLAESAAALVATVELFEQLRSRTADTLGIKTMVTDRVRHEIAAIMAKRGDLHPAQSSGSQRSPFTSGVVRP